MEQTEENIEILNDFVAEGLEMLEGLEGDMMRIENALDTHSAPDLELFHAVFRTFHSIKGAAGFLMLSRIEEVCHHAETMLDLFRKSLAQISSSHISLFLSAGDLIRNMLLKAQDDYHDQALEQEAVEMVSLFKKSEPKLVGSAEKEADVSDIHFKELMQQLDSMESRLISAGPVCSSDLLRELAYQMSGLSPHFDILGHRELSALVSRMGELFIKISQIEGRIDLDLADIQVRLIESLRNSARSIYKGHTTTESVASMLDLLRELHTKSGTEVLGKDSQALLGSLLMDMGMIDKAELDQALARQESPIGEILLDMNLIDKDQLKVGLQLQDQKRSKNKNTEGKVRNLRVDLRKLDLLSNLVGEMVIAENMVTQHPILYQEGMEELRKPATALNRISRELQDLVMSLRMAPIDATFRKMNRVVRDVCQKLEKKVNITLRGEHTEIDKNVIENLSSPLIHIIRNAVDHGIETPQERLGKGKSETGNLILEASQEGGEVRIRIQDDGKGIDPDAILAKALEKGVIGPEASFSNPEEIFQLLFAPGFSTASQVTEVSGRGVGMDVVKRNVEELHGRIEVKSKVGEGSTFMLYIPLTLSIIEGMLVRVGETVLVIPLLNIRETLVARGKVITRGIDEYDHIKIRDQLIPIVPLSDYLGVNADAEDIDQGLLVVVESGGSNCCLHLDEILGQRQTVIKRASKFLGNIKGISGFTILSDGEIALILDIARLENLFQA